MQKENLNDIWKLLINIWIISWNDFSFVENQTYPRPSHPNKELRKNIMNKLYFCSTNLWKKKKIESELKSINSNINLEIIDVEVNEIQNSDNEIVSKYKVIDVFNKINKPCFSIDSWLFILELNNFPWSFIKDTLQTIWIKWILKLLENVSSRECYISNSLSYYDWKKLKVFSEKIFWEISYDINNNFNNSFSWSDLHKIFIPKGYKKTLSQMTDEEYINWDSIEKENWITKQFMDWYMCKYSIKSSNYLL